MSGKSGRDNIQRRGFIKGMLIAAGTAAVGGSFPMRANGAGTTFPCDGPIGSDPRVLRGGNVPSVFNIAHWLRDNRLTFRTNSVLISHSPCDGYEGSQPILADNGNYEVRNVTIRSAAPVVDLGVRRLLLGKPVLSGFCSRGLGWP